MPTTTAVEKQDERATPVERIQSGPTYRPAVDIVEKDQELLVLADVPGAGPNDIDVRLEQGELSIRAKVAPRREGVKHRLLREYGVGDFHRVFRVGEEIDSTAIAAELRDGVLTLRLPKTESAKPRKIEVKLV